MEEQNIIMEKLKKINPETVCAIIAIILVVIIIINLASPSPIPEDYRELRNNLRAQNYEVESETDGEYAIGMFIDLLTTVLYYEPEYIEDEMDKVMYQISESISENQARELINSAVCTVTAVNEYENNFLVVIYFDNTKIAKTFYNYLKPAFNFIKQYGSDWYGYDNIPLDEYTFGQDGKTVYLGTKDALDACK